MSAHTFLLAACLFGIQCALTALTILWQNTSLDGLASAAWYASWLIPFVGYIAVLYSSSLFAAHTRVVRLALLTVASLFSTFGGTLVFLAVCMSLGIPLRHT